MLKKIILVLLLCQTCVFSQNLLNNPESVVYDSLYNRYLISNSGTGDIVAMDTLGNQSYFVTGQQCFNGVTIKDAILFVSCGLYGVKGFNLNNGDLVMNVPIAGANFSNDIVADDSGFVYASYSMDNRIYKIDTRSQNYWIYISSGLTAPNGLFFDRENNRLLICSYVYNSPIQAIDLTDSTLYTVTGTSLDGLDGLTADNDGNYYVSSWQTNSIYVFPGGFTASPQLFANMPDDPADISYDLTNDVLAVPLYNLSQVELIQGFSGIKNHSTTAIPQHIEMRDNYPNPFNASTDVEFLLPFETNVKLEIVDVSGRVVLLLLNDYLNAGKHRITWNAGNMPSGTYFYRLSTPDQSKTKLMILLK